MDPTLLRQTTTTRILEQPAPKALRFRYECEGRSAGSLPGATSTHDKKTFPKIQVVSSSPDVLLGKGVVVVSCVTVDTPHRPHPHNLVGKEGCKKGVCTMEINTNENGHMVCEFSNLGIQCVKKKDIEESLRVREEIRVDPFRTTFSHKQQPGSIDLNAVRLCFQVFLEGPDRGQFKVPLTPVVSEPIYDKKAINDLTIMKLSDCTSPALGNKEIILLCDKVSKDDIEIRFYETDGQTGGVVWEAFGDFQPSDVHKQYAICFRTPAYKELEIPSPVRVWIQLRCPSKDTISVPRLFEYTPLTQDLAEALSLTQAKRKRLNCQRVERHISSGGGASNFLSPQQQHHHTHTHHHQNPGQHLFQQPPPPPPQLLLQPASSPYGMPSPQHQRHSPLPSPSSPYGNNNNYHQNIPLSPQQQYNYAPTIKQEPGEQQQQWTQHQQQQMLLLSPVNSPQQQQQEEENHSPPIMDISLSNISLPHLSDVNLSLLEAHLSENFSERLDLG